MKKLFSNVRKLNAAKAAAVRLQDGSMSRQWALFGIVVLMLGGALSWYLYSVHASIDMQERKRLSVQAKVVDDNLSAQLTATSRALDSIRQDWLFLSAQKDGKSLINRRLQTLTQIMSGIRTLVVQSADGTVIASNREQLIGENYFKLERFQTILHSANPSTLFVSPPFKTPLGVYAMSLGKAILNDRGEFAGVVLAILDPEYFTTLLGSVRYAPDMWTSLAHADGKLFMFAPARPGTEGMDLAQPGSFYSRHRDSGQVATVMTGVVYATGEERMMAQRTIRPASLQMDKPLLLAVGRDLSSIFSGWRRDALARAGVFGMLVLMAALSLNVYLRRQQKLIAAEIAKMASDHQLRESEARFRTVVEVIPDAIVLHCGGRISFVNPAAVEMFGAKAEADLIGKPILELIHPDFHKIELERVKNGVEQGKAAPRIEERYVKLNGTTFDAEVQGRPIVLAGAPSVLATLRDITERKRVEQESIRQMDELQRWQELTIGREDRMRQLKVEVNELLVTDGQPARYSVEAAPGEGHK